MVELVVVIIFLIVIACVKIYRATQRQAEREREYVAERKMCGCLLFCRLYAAAKAVLILIAAGSVFYIFLSLAMNEPISQHDRTDFISGQTPVSHSKAAFFQTVQSGLPLPPSP